MIQPQSDEQATTYRLVVDTDTGMTSSPWPFINLEAAIQAAPKLNHSRIIRGRHPYNGLAQFVGNQCVAVVPLRSAA